MEKHLEEVFEETKKARLNAYAPYSKFKVGGGMLLKNGKIITGFNIENASYGLCNCAERNTIFRCMMEGYTKDDFECLMVLGDTKEPISPCGACRQVMSELMNKDTKVILANVKGDLLETTVSDLLPYSFELSDLDV